MSPVVDSTMFDQLMLLPETIEKLVNYPTGMQHENHNHHQRHRQAREKGVGDIAPVDILETPKAYTFFLDVPGLSKSDIQVTVEEDTILVIRSNGKRKREEVEEEGCKYLFLERKAARKFLRKFRLPDDSNPSTITAKHENGVLGVTVEKRPPPPEAKPKTVEVSIA